MGTTKTTAEKIAVMQAYLDGKTIQDNIGGEWTDWAIKQEPLFHWGVNDYRIKPEPKKVPFDESDYESILGKKIRHEKLIFTGLLTSVGDGKIVIGNKEFNILLSSKYLYWYNETVKEWMPCMKTTITVNN